MLLIVSPRFHPLLRVFSMTIPTKAYFFVKKKIISFLIFLGAVINIASGCRKTLRSTSSHQIPTAIACSPISHHLVVIAYDDGSIEIFDDRESWLTNGDYQVCYIHSYFFFSGLLILHAFGVKKSRRVT